MGGGGEKKEKSLSVLNISQIFSAVLQAQARVILATRKWRAGNFRFAFKVLNSLNCESPFILQFSKWP